MTQVVRQLTLRPITSRCAGVWTQTGSPCVYTHILPHAHSIPTCTKVKVQRNYCVRRRVAIKYAKRYNVSHWLSAYTTKCDSHCPHANLRQKCPKKKTPGYCFADSALADPAGENKRLPNLTWVQKKFTIHHRCMLKGHEIQQTTENGKRQRRYDTKMQIVFKGKLCHRETLHAEKRNLKNCLTRLRTVSAVCITWYNIKKRNAAMRSHSVVLKKSYFPQNH
jgi:hypothetical protein